MKFTDSDIGEFQALWKKEVGIEISLSQAREYAENIVGLVEIVIGTSSHEEQPP